MVDPPKEFRKFFFASPPIVQSGHIRFEGNSRRRRRRKVSFAKLCVEYMGTVLKIWGPLLCVFCLSYMILSQLYIVDICKRFVKWESFVVTEFDTLFKKEH